MKPAADSDPRRWRMLALLTAAELLGVSPWFTASAVSPRLSELWGLSLAQGAMLVTMVQIGFVAGTAVAAVLNLADLFSARAYFAACALADAQEAASARRLLVSARIRSRSSCRSSGVFCSRSPTMISAATL